MKQTKKFLMKAVLMMALFVATVILAQSFGAKKTYADIQSGRCGEKATWTLETNTLTISGSGEMDDYDRDKNLSPWFLLSDSIKKVVIEDGIESIGKNAFSGLSVLTNVTIPQSVKKIGNNAFQSCDKLSKVNITDLAQWCQIEFDGYFANPLYYAHDLYLNGKRIEQLEIPEGVTKISDYAFYTYRVPVIVLPSVPIGGGTGRIIKESFIESVKFPSTLKSIGAYAFYGRKGLETINFSDSITSIGECAFDNTKWITNQIEGPIIINDILYKVKKSSGENIVIPDGVKSISGKAFSLCEELKIISLPDSVETIDKGAFSGFSGKVYCNDTFKPEKQNYGGDVTWEVIGTVIPGDLDGNGAVDSDDAIYLLMYTLFPDDYPLNQDADYDGSGAVDSDDAIYLLMHTLFPGDYPIVKNEED